MTDAEDGGLRLLILRALSCGERAHPLPLDCQYDQRVSGLLRLAERNRVAPVVAHYLKEHNAALPSGDWTAHHDASVARMRAVLGEVDSIAARCASSGKRGLESGGTEYVKRLSDEAVWIELQWRPIAGRWIRKDQEPDGAAELVNDFETLTVGI